MSNDDTTDLDRDADRRRQGRREVSNASGRGTVFDTIGVVRAISDCFERVWRGVRLRNRPMDRLLRVAETVVLTSTVAAFAVTVLAVHGSTAVFEANPVTRRIVSLVGWTVAGCLAVGTVSGVFLLYRRVRNTAPRVVLVGAALVVAISVADVAITLSAGARVGFLRALGVDTAIPICVTAGVATGLWLSAGRSPTATDE